MSTHTTRENIYLITSTHITNFSIAPWVKYPPMFKSLLPSLEFLLDSWVAQPAFNGELNLFIPFK